MPALTNRLQNIRATGPVLEILIGPSSTYLNTVQPTQVPPPVKALALIDTGASMTVIRTGIAQQLGISPTGLTNIHTPSHAYIPCYQYDIGLNIPLFNINFELVATEAHLQGQPFGCLIGRDILSRAVFIYTGYDNSFTLAI